MWSIYIWIHPPFCVWCPFLFVVIDNCYMNLTLTNSKWGQLEAFFRCVLKPNCIILAVSIDTFTNLFIYMSVFFFFFCYLYIIDYFACLKFFNINIKCCKIWTVFGSIEIDITKTFFSFTSTRGDWKCWWTIILFFFSLDH